MALRNLPPLRAAHRRFNFDADRPLLSALEEVRDLLHASHRAARQGLSRLQAFLGRCLLSILLLLRAEQVNQDLDLHLASLPAQN